MEFREAWRSLRHARGFAAIAVLTLAIGIAASTAVFTIVNAVLLRPLPFPDPDRLVLLVHTSGSVTAPGVSAAKFRAWRDGASAAFGETAAYRFPLLTNVAGDRLEQEQIAAGRVTRSFFPLFGASAMHGRVFDADEDRPGGPHVVVLSHGFWLRRFGGSPQAIGMAVTLDGEPHRVIGVLAASFDPRSASPAGVAVPDVWLPLQLNPEDRGDANNLLAAGRLHDAMTLAAAISETARAETAFSREFPGVLRPTVHLAVVPLASLVTGNARASLLLLLAAVAALLLIACGNIASLLLVRASRRQREMAIRLAVGAGHGRLVRQLLAETLLLALAGGVVGFVLGLIGVRAFLLLQPGNIPRIAPDGSDITADWRVVLFAIAVSTGSALIAALLPAWRSRRFEITGALRSSAVAAGFGVRHQKARALVMVSEIAIAALLLITATLLVRSVAALRALHPGFDAANVLTLRIAATEARFADTAATTQLVDEGVRLVRILPDVETAGALLTELPLEGDNANLAIGVAGRPPDQSILGSWRIVSPGYFDVFRIPLVRGRWFSAQDVRGGEPVVVINETLARRLWGSADPLVDRLVLGEGAGPEFADVPRRVIGIVGDIRHAGLARDPRAAAYVPLAQLPDAAMAFFNALGGRLTWIVRTRGEPRALAAAVEAALRKASNLPTTRMRSMDDVSATSVARQQFEMWLMTLFSASAMLVTAVGIYGIAAVAVAQGTREIGIRFALGAAASHIRRHVLVNGLLLTMAGLAIGLAGAAALTRALSTFLFGISPHDPLTFAAVPSAVIAVTLVATWLPASRAAHVAPTIALRE